MLTFLLTAALLVLAVAGAELVRSTCRRQLTAPLAPRLATGRPAERTADLD